MGQRGVHGATLAFGDRSTRDANATQAVRRLWMLMLGGGLLVSTVLGLRDAVDVDVWLHLRIGDELRAGTKFAGLPDPLVVLADQGYIPTQWLGEIILSLVYQKLGFAGVWALRLIGLYLLVGLVYATARFFADPLRAAGTTLIAVLATSGAWGERPQLAGLVLGAAAVHMWVRAWTRRSVPVWIIPLVWLWACVHGSWILGIATGLLFTVAMLGDPERRRAWRGLITVNSLSVTAVTLTPLGLELLATPFHVGTSARAAVAEWQAPSWGNPLLLMVLAMVAVALGRPSRQPDFRLMLLLMLAAVALALPTVRTIAFGALLAAPACAAGLTRFSTGGSGPRLAGREVSTSMAASVALIMALSALLDPPRTDPLNGSVATSLALLEPGSHVVVARPLSNWVLHRYPHLLPLQDLRAEVYSEQTAVDYASFAQAEDGWQRYAREHDVRAILIEVDSDLARALQSDRDWADMASEGEYQMWAAVQE